MAHRCDQIQVGDRLVAVNGINVRTLKHTDIYTLLKHAGDRVRLQLEYNLHDTCKCFYSSLWCWVLIFPPPYTLKLTCVHRF
jgi:hypothetical protein